MLSQHPKKQSKFVSIERESVQTSENLCIFRFSDLASGYIILSNTVKLTFRVIIVRLMLQIPAESIAIKVKTNQRVEIVNTINQVNTIIYVNL